MLILFMDQTSTSVGLHLHHTWVSSVTCDMWKLLLAQVFQNGLSYSIIEQFVQSIVPYHGTLEPGVGAALQAVLHVPVLLQLRALPGHRGQAGGQPGHHAAALAGDSVKYYIKCKM